MHNVIHSDSDIGFSVELSRHGDSEIAALAYQLWEDRGSPPGSPEEDWFLAEARLAGEQKVSAMAGDHEPERAETDLHFFDQVHDSPGEPGEEFAGQFHINIAPGIVEIRAPKDRGGVSAIPASERPVPRVSGRVAKGPGARQG